MTFSNLSINKQTNKKYSFDEGYNYCWPTPILITKIQEGEIPVVNDDFIISILEIEDSEKIEDINSFFREKIKEVNR